MSLLRHVPIAALLLVGQACSENWNCPDSHTDLDGECLPLVDASEPTRDAAHGPDAMAPPGENDAGADCPRAQTRDPATGACVEKCTVDNGGCRAEDRCVPGTSLDVAPTCMCTETNACGGACLGQLEHNPGDACSNELVGACERQGQYVCTSEQSVACNAATPAAGTELCGDEIDNDCDGQVDEPDATDAATWFQDCDGDGYAASTAGSVKGCTKPADVDECTWTAVIPQESSRTHWDCNDASAAYSPAVTSYGLPPFGFTSFDLNCNGTPEPAVGEQEIPLICYQPVVDCLNSERPTSCRVQRASRVVNCLFWQLPNGRFSITPQSKCPDSGARQAYFHEFSDGYGVDYYVLEDPVWRCR